MKGKFKLIFIIAIILVVVITGGLFFYLSGLGAVDSNNEEPVTVNIPSGSGASYIVEILDENGLVKNKTCAKINARIGGYDSLQANTYIFNKSMTVPEMFKAINTGDFNYLSKEKLTVREGLTIPQVAEAIAIELPFSKDEIIKKWSDKTYLKELIGQYWFLSDDILDSDIKYPLEGYLYPETYFITEENPSIESITSMMLDMMDTQLTSIKGELESNKYSIHELLTLASIVERESSNVSDAMPEVAGVFINRLDKGISLGSDVTVNYIFEKDGVELTMSQLDSDNKYNTRKFTGLPPGPICSVNIKAIDSVLNYKDTEYMFFYATPEGEIIFSKTVEEHNKAVEEHPWTAEQAE
ncbi:MAG: endolytic transglycosylase MltG, partial [Firmicutes bacterium]|nr:endolytic transglycosylase MltG [Bacillota bacterium]MBR3787617.1 endolytic transglycosylase MltG [Bacillota bacterium]MBR6799353.1 endolytic transglycosylase MltG [Bacillota bacterium]